MWKLSVDPSGESAVASKTIKHIDEDVSETFEVPHDTISVESEGCGAYKVTTPTHVLTYNISHITNARENYVVAGYEAMVTCKRIDKEKTINDKRLCIVYYDHRMFIDVYHDGKYKYSQHLYNRWRYNVAPLACVFNDTVICVKECGAGGVKLEACDCDGAIVYTKVLSAPEYVYDIGVNIDGSHLIINGFVWTPIDFMAVMTPSLKCYEVLIDEYYIRRINIHDSCNEVDGCANKDPDEHGCEFMHVHCNAQVGCIATPHYNWKCAHRGERTEPVSCIGWEEAPTPTFNTHES